MAEPIEMPFGLRTGEHKESCIRWVYTPWEGAFWGKVAAHFKVWGRLTVNPARTAEPIEMPFGLWTRMGRRNSVLD